MDKEERKIQITLAQLRTDVQIWLTICFGGIAIFVSMVLAAWQEYFSTPTTETLLKNSFLVSIATGFAGMIIITMISVKKMKAKRAEMDKL